MRLNRAGRLARAGNIAQAVEEARATVQLLQRDEKPDAQVRSLYNVFKFFLIILLPKIAVGAKSSRTPQIGKLQNGKINKSVSDLNRCTKFFNNIPILSDTTKLDNNKLNRSLLFP